MKKFVIILLSSIILLSPVYGAGSGGSGSSGGSGDGDNIQDGPKPAGKFRLGYKEVERANKAAKKGKLKKAEQKYKKALNHLLEANAEQPEIKEENLEKEEEPLELSEEAPAAEDNKSE